MSHQEKGFHEIMKLCANETDEKNLMALLDLLLTPEEKNDLGMRYWIIKELLAGKKTQREMARELNVSIAKITRGSNELKRINQDFLAHLKKLLITP